MPLKERDLEKREIKLAIGDLVGTGEIRFTHYKHVEAYCIDKFALHPKGEDWGITHVPTGFLVCTIRGSKRRALAILSAIHEANLDWDFTSIRSPKIKKMKPVMRELLTPLYNKGWICARV